MNSHYNELTVFEVFSANDFDYKIRIYNHN